MTDQYGRPISIAEREIEEIRQAMQAARDCTRPAQPATDVEAAREALRQAERKQQEIIDQANAPQREIFAARQALAEAQQRAEAARGAMGEYSGQCAGVERANEALYAEMVKVSSEVNARLKPLIENARAAAIKAETARRRNGLNDVLSPTPAEFDLPIRFAKLPQAQQAALSNLFSMVFDREPWPGLRQLDVNNQQHILDQFYEWLNSQ